MNQKLSPSKHTSSHLSDFLWDLWCTASVVGIWPRFVEPQLIGTKKLNISIPNLPSDLNGLKILHFSDLHLCSKVSHAFLNKLISKIRALSPDLVVFTGDFLCYSTLEDKELFQSIFKKIHAPYGCYAILGNHDYAESVSINAQGEYDVVTKGNSTIGKGFSRLFKKTILKKVVTPKAQTVPLHQELVAALKQTSFTLLNNTSKVIPIKNHAINLVGLGEYTLGRCHPEQAFQTYDTRYPGIVLSHNPDSIPMLKNYPGNLILCGHTHGGQVNLPWMWKKFTCLENMEFKYGLKKIHDKWVYISRGLGSVMQFRWFAMPEIVLLTLENTP